MRKLASSNAANFLKSPPRASVCGKILTAALSTVLAACSVVTPASITSTTGQLPQGQSVQLAPFEQDGSLRAAFGQALVDAMAAQSIERLDGAPVIAEFAIGARDASAGLADPAASSDAAVVWESLPRDQSRFDNCEAQRLRATLVLLDRAGGEILYRGVGESDACAFGDQELVQLADTLIADARGALSAN